MPSSDSGGLPSPPPSQTGWPWDSQSLELPVCIEDGRNWPKISIVTPSYNQAQFLETTILSVLNQNYPNLEYMIMDGGSTDSSVDIIRKYEDRLAYWVSEPDKGQANAINRGFNRATGDIFAWLNSDDSYEPGTLQSVAEIFAKNADIHLVYGEGWYISSEGDRIRPCRFVRSNFRELYLHNKDPILQQAAFWRRGLWLEVGPLDESLHWTLDWDWFIRAYKRASFHYVPQFLANYRIQPKAKTRNRTMDMLLEVAMITRRYGRWWYPNNVVQQARYLAFRVKNGTRCWPSFAAFPLQLFASLPSIILERALHGMYRV